MLRFATEGERPLRACGERPQQRRAAAHVSNLASNSTTNTLPPSGVDERLDEREHILLPLEDRSAYGGEQNTSQGRLPLELRRAVPRGKTLPDSTRVALRNIQQGGVLTNHAGGGKVLFVKGGSEWRAAEGLRAPGR